MAIINPPGRAGIIFVIHEWLQRRQRLAAGISDNRLHGHDASRLCPPYKILPLILRHTPTPRTPVAALERTLPGSPGEAAAGLGGHAAATPGRAHRAIAADGAGQALVGAHAAAGNMHRRLCYTTAAVIADGNGRPGAVVIAAATAAARALGARGRLLARRLGVSKAPETPLSFLPMLPPVEPCASAAGGPPIATAAKKANTPRCRSFMTHPRIPIHRHI